MNNIFRILLIVVFSILFFASCSPPSTEVAYFSPTPTLANMPLPSKTPHIQFTVPEIEFELPDFTPTQRQATPTEIQLPVVYGNVEHKYCQSPSILLPIADTQGLNENEIVEKLMDLYLAYFNAPEAPAYCRIDGYHIDEVYSYENLSLLPLTPKGDFLRGVLFAIKLIQIPNFWMSIGGDIDQQNWLHTGANVAVFRSDSGYTMKFAHP